MSEEKAKQAAEKVRAPWSVENKNHYRKDTCLWLEDQHRHRKTPAAQNLALMRSALLAIIPFDKTQTLNDYLYQYQRKPSDAIKLIKNLRPI